MALLRLPRMRLFSSTAFVSAAGDVPCVLCHDGGCGHERSQRHSVEHELSNDVELDCVGCGVLLLRLPSVRLNFATLLSSSAFAFVSAAGDVPCVLC